jgi:hypothetical protein
MSPGPACQAFWQTSAVFDGTVISIEPVQRDDFIGGSTVRITENVVRLDVRQAWKGVDTSTIEVVTNVGGGSCGFDFKLGGRYLVFADRGTLDGRLQVSICNLTREFDGTGDAAAFLASLALPFKGGRAFGKIDLSVRSFKPDDGASKRMPFEIPVRLVGNGQERKVTTTAGRYEFSGLVPGRYSVTITVPTGYSTWRTEREAEIHDGRGCAQTDFTLSPAGRISGRLVDTNGRGVYNVSVDVTAFDATIHPRYGFAPVEVRSDGNGYFDVEHLPPGHYIAAINLRDLPDEWNPYPRTVYPASDEPPQVIELTLGQTVDLGPWVLPPPLKVVEVSGVITWHDGTPAAGVNVSASDVTGNPAERARGAGGATSGPHGQFMIKLRERREYTFIARIGSGPRLPVAAPRITTRSAVPPVRIVIQANPK